MMSRTAANEYFWSLLKRLKDIQLAKAKDDFGWLFVVQAEYGAIDGGLFKKSWELISLLLTILI